MRQSSRTTHPQAADNTIQVLAFLLDEEQRDPLEVYRAHLDGILKKAGVDAVESRQEFAALEVAQQLGLEVLFQDGVVAFYHPTVSEDYVHGKVSAFLAQR
jgi:hypothetical protein